MARKKEEQTVVADARQQDYELVYIIRPEMSDEELETRVDNVSQFITARDGIVEDVQKWGKRKLAYPIKQNLEGNYILTRFKLSPARCSELESSLKISEDVLRHLLIRVGS